MKRLLWAIDEAGNEAIYVNGKLRSRFDNIFWGDLRNAAKPSTLFELELIAVKFEDEWPDRAADLKPLKRKTARSK